MSVAGPHGEGGVHIIHDARADIFSNMVSNPRIRLGISKGAHPESTGGPWELFGPHQHI